MSDYSRQELFAPIGTDGQSRIRASRVVIVGCGALGSFQAEMLTRAGVGSLHMIDRDVIELSNLQRQIVFTHADAEAGLPKATAAAARLRAVNPDVEIEGIVRDVHAGNIEELICGDRAPDVVLDGTDNFETRMLLNEACVKHNLPWVYGGCVGSEGTAALIPRIAADV